MAIYLSFLVPKITAIAHAMPTKAWPTPSAWNHEYDRASDFIPQLDDVLSGKTLKVDSKQFAYYSIPDEMGIQNEDVKRKRVLFSLNVQPQYENAIIDAQIEFYSNSIIFVENILSFGVAMAPDSNEEWPILPPF